MILDPTVPSRARAERPAWPRTTARACALAIVPALLLVAACGREPAVRIEGEELTVACGACIFEMEGVENCPWAAEFHGEHYLLKGSFERDHNSHMPDGICNMERRAIVWGELRGGVIHVARLELLAPEAVPEDPRFTPADIH